MNSLLNFMGKVVYEVLLPFYQLIIILISPFNSKAKQWLIGRKNWQEKLKSFQWRKGKRVWFHCASLGEFEQARPVLEKWGCEHPNDSIILTFFSPSGYEVRKNYECADIILYLPLDTAHNARLFIEYIKPNIALFVKYEFWHHYLNELNKRKIPIILFSSAFRKQQVFFKWYGIFFLNMLKTFTMIFVQNHESKNLLNKISIPAEVNYDTRFDRVYEIAQSPKNFPAIEKFKEGSKIFIAGSTWRKDEEMILQLIRDRALTGYKYIIAPHNVNPVKIAALKESIPVSKLLLSELTPANANKTNVIVVDSIGQLSSLYAFANISYVGGGFNKSVHNVLEAAVYGLPIIFGPNHSKSAEALELQENGAAFSFSTYPELIKLVQNLTGPDDRSINRAITQSKTYVTGRRGGAERVIFEMNTLLS